jgi:hypothetical protein
MACLHRKGKHEPSVNVGKAFSSDCCPGLHGYYGFRFKTERASNPGDLGGEPWTLAMVADRADVSLTRVEAEGPSRASSGRNRAELEPGLECQHPFQRQPATESMHPNGSGRANRGANSASGPSQLCMDHLSVRRAGPKDAETIAALFQSVYRDSSPLPLHRFCLGAFGGRAQLRDCG